MYLLDLWFDAFHYFRENLGDYFFKYFKYFVLLLFYLSVGQLSLEWLLWLHSGH